MYGLIIHKRNANKNGKNNMFRKLVSNLPFNPSLIGQVSFYAKRMHREQSIRRTGLVLIVLAMFIQIFAVVSPPQQTLARVGNDLIPGGATSQGELVNHCNANNYDFATILDYFKISCQDLFFGQVRTINSAEYGGQLFSMGRAPYNKPGETPVDIPGLGRFYMRYLDGWGNSNYQAIVGASGITGKPFMVLFDCGNLVIVGPPTVEQPQKVISCSDLDISVSSATKVPVGTDIAVLGHASGENIPAGELVDMYYDFLNAKTGRLLSSQEARGVPFSGSRANDTVNRMFKVSEPGHFQFRLSVKYDGSTKDAAGNGVGSCIRDVYVATPPPEPKKVIVCSNLISSFGNGQKVVSGSNLTVRGQASGRNVSDGELVDMYYDYVDSTGKVLGTQKALGNKFKGSTAEDKVPRSFKIEKPGTYTFRLAVKYDSGSKDAEGNQTGDCAKKVIVEPPCDKDKTGQDDTKCLIQSKKARNDTQKIENADGTTAQAGDVITYTLATTNTSKNTTVKDYVVQENMIDVLQYADIINLSGGTKDKYGVVSWSPIDIRPQETINKKITIKIKNPIPQTPVSKSDPGSYDMKLTNIYGNTVNIKLPPSITKTTEYVTRELPNTGPGETLAAGFVLVTIIGYFFARSRLIAKEVDIIRNDYATSGSA